MRAHLQTLGRLPYPKLCAIELDTLVNSIQALVPNALIRANWTGLGFHIYDVYDTERRIGVIEKYTPENFDPDSSILRFVPTTCL